jgi:hypothetical protein
VINGIERRAAGKLKQCRRYLLPPLYILGYEKYHDCNCNYQQVPTSINQGNYFYVEYFSGQEIYQKGYNRQDYAEYTEYRKYKPISIMLHYLPHALIFLAGITLTLY